MSRPKRLVMVQASRVKVGDTVTLPHVSFRVQRVYKGGGRLSFITDGGFPLDLDPYSMVAVLR